MLYLFADCELDTERVTLHRAGKPIKLQRQVFKVLTYLVEHRNQIVSKDDLAEQVYKGAIANTTIEGCLKKVRQAVGDNGRDQRIIATRFGFGYEFVVPVVMRSKDLLAEAPPPGPSPPVPSPAPETVPEFTGRAPQLSASDIHMAEKKIVTVLCCGLPPVAGQRTGAELDLLLSQMQALYSLVRQAVDQYGGMLQPVAGTRFLALFDASAAQDDHAPRAVLAAFELHQQLIAPQNTSHASVEDALTVRIGLHTGEVIVGGFAEDQVMATVMVGDTALLATTLQEAAEPGTILCSAATARLIQGVAHIESVQPLRLAGPSTPQTVYKVLRRELQQPCRVSPRGRTRHQFVGRRQELRTLRLRFAEVEAGRGHAVSIVGEPGIGKSRLLREFRHSLANCQMTYLATQGCANGSAIAALPARDLLQQYCEMIADDSLAAKRAKVYQCLQAAGMEPETYAPGLFHLLGIAEGAGQLTMLNPAMVEAQTMTAFRRVFLQGSRPRPLVIAIDDMNCLDAVSESYLAAIIEDVAHAPVLLLTTSGTDYSPAWLEASHATKLTLAPLTREESRYLVQAILPSERRHLAPRIVAKGSGNPLFLESAAWLMAEQVVSDTEIPESLHDVLMARLDGLPEIPKRLVQMAAVLGWTCTTPLLEALWDGPGTMQATLADLQQRALCDTQPGVSGLVYPLVHTALRDIAYTYLTPASRQALHLAAAQALEAHDAARLDDGVERLAYHYGRAEQADKAIDYLSRAAERATQRFDYAEVVTALRETLDQAESLPATPQRESLCLALHLRLADALAHQQRYAEAVQLLVSHQERVDALQDAQLASRWALLLSCIHSRLGEWPEVALQAQRTVELAIRCADEATLGTAYHLLAMERYWAGHPLQGVDSGHNAVTLLERSAPGYRLGLAHFTLGLNALLSGDFTLTLEAAGQVQVIGEAIRDVQLQTYAAWMTGWCEATRGRAETGITACERALTLAPDPLNMAFATGWLGYAMLEHGKPDAVPQLTRAAALMGQMQYWRHQSLFTTFLGEAYRMQGDLDRARDTALQGLTLARESQYHFGIAWAQRVLGQIAQDRGTLTEAARALDEACAMFTAMPARFEVGRSHLALADLAHRQGDLAAASQHRREAQHLFTALHVPHYVQITAQRAHVLGL